MNTTECEVKITGLEEVGQYHDKVAREDVERLKEYLSAQYSNVTSCTGPHQQASTVGPSLRLGVVSVDHHIRVDQTGHSISS